MSVDLRHGDNLKVLPTLPAGSVDAIVTDPPYGLAFMGRAWDQQVPVDVWSECLRVLKPGGHLLAFGGTRTAHRLAVAIEDAGFEIRDTITWLYGQGFPKSRDVAKDIDKAAGAPREVVGAYRSPENTTGFKGQSGRGIYAADQRVDGELRPITAPATEAARQWQGWGTALKPASEPIIVARKPLSGTVAATVLAFGTGGLNVDACRVKAQSGDYAHAGNANSTDRQDMYEGGRFANRGRQVEPNAAGRWPANVVLTHAADCADLCVEGCPVAELDAQSGTTPSGGRLDTAGIKAANGVFGARPANLTATYERDQGGASRFFPTFRYQAKAPTSERPKIDGQGWPTVKPLALMRWLVRLVTPPGGLVLDPFAGTGPTLQAAELEGFDSLGVELDPHAYALACQRLGIEVAA